MTYPVSNWILWKCIKRTSSIIEDQLYAKTEIRKWLHTGDVFKLELIKNGFHTVKLLIQQGSALMSTHKIKKIRQCKIIRATATEDNAGCDFNISDFMDFLFVLLRPKYIQHNVEVLSPSQNYNSSF